MRIVKRVLYFGLLCSVGIAMLGCTIIPSAQKYPYDDPAWVLTRGQEISDNLEAYIRDWLAGRVPALLPESVLPPGMYVNPIDPNQRDSAHKDMRLKAWDTCVPADYWICRKAEYVDNNALMSLYPDPHYTYMLNVFYLAPFGSTTIIKGKFPKSRFMLITPSPPLNGVTYRWYAFGGAENPIIDVDIAPDSGSINPFIKGASRTATNRNYTVTVENRIGNLATGPDQYCPKPPYYRAPGNVRWGSGIHYSGPGLYGPPDGKTALWRCGEFWVRYGLPDGYNPATKASFDALAGAGLPTMYHQLSSGEKFMIVGDMNAANDSYLKKHPAVYADADIGDKQFQGKEWGWNKMFGILQSVASGMFIEYGQSKSLMHDIVRGVEGRGYDIAAPGNWEGSATCVNQCNYFTRGNKVGDGSVLVLTGKLPTFPSTQNGATTMPGGEMRYWSLTNNEDATDQPGRDPGVCTASIADFEIKLDSKRRFILCFSKPADKPSNATAANGVTWVNWGPNSNTHHTWRWVSVNPDWSFSKTPHEHNLTWIKTGWESPGYDSKMIGENNRTGWLGEYLPKANYMSKACFENLGSPVTWAKVDGVAWGCCGSPMASSNQSGWVVTLMPLLIGLVSCVLRRLRWNI